MTLCLFDNAWAGPCNQPADDSGYCVVHKGVNCHVCGKKATKSCPSASSMVCGAPLCDTCKCTYHSR